MGTQTTNACSRYLSCGTLGGSTYCCSKGTKGGDGGSLETTQEEIDQMNRRRISKQQSAVSDRQPNMVSDPAMVP